MVNFPNIFINLKTKVDVLDIGKLKAVPVDLKNLNNVLDKQVAKNKKMRKFLMQLLRFILINTAQRNKI